MLHRPRQVTEPDVDELLLVVADEPEHIAGIGKHESSLPK
jgi:hypothetical protein